jgi:NAD+ synthase (glutamine-hydrolysing)
MNFFNFNSHRFIRVAAAIPNVIIGCPQKNIHEIIKLATEAENNNVSIVCFPELSLPGYTCDDLFQQRIVIEACESAIHEILNATKNFNCVIIVGAPIVEQQMLFNCAVVIYKGVIKGIIPKTFLPNYREYYEKRQFNSSISLVSDEIMYAGQISIPFGVHLQFVCDVTSKIVFSVELCEDLWVPISPSVFDALAGAQITFNLSASNASVGKAEYRRKLVSSHSAKCISAYIYCSAGYGESTNDLAWDGHALIVENGNILNETNRFCYKNQIIWSEIDVDRLDSDRLRMGSFSDCAITHRSKISSVRRILLGLDYNSSPSLPLSRQISRYPFIPNCIDEQDEVCDEVLNIQRHGLIKRLRSCSINKVVIGVSGGLDSTLALIVCVLAMDQMGLERENILAYTLPGFGTSGQTLAQARDIIRMFGCSFGEIDITALCNQQIRDMGLVLDKECKEYDVTFENIQAGNRTNILFRIANKENAIVIGTSDVSELALGWCTYGVGDHMAHYHLNASVPKTLVKQIIQCLIRQRLFSLEINKVLNDILNTPISPELIPLNNEKMSPQLTEEKVGPFVLQDFNLYYITRYGYKPTKVAFMSWNAWNVGDQQSSVDVGDLKKYDIGTIKRNLNIFVTRFFGTSQFKRTAIPNAPKIGSGGSLSPRGDYRAPSDSDPEAWLFSVAKIPDNDLCGTRIS